MPSLLEAEERVLSTLNADGSRRWLDPKPVEGFFRSRRRLLGWVLIGIFMVLPHLHFNGRQLFFVNIADGEFTFFGMTFLRTDTLLFALTIISIGVTIFFVTALFGRVWCGWACPQTVYLEFVFRPIARLFDGKGRSGLRGAFSKLPRQARWVMRWGLSALICFHLANTFLAYFVGSRTVMSWSFSPPWEHPAGFLFVLFITVMMLVNFGFFREQICFIACPYGRLQSVMLDRQSLIVGYDERRGEPRGKLKKGKKTGGDDVVSLTVLPDASAPGTATGGEDALGDCVACNRCVAVCPTGIDIRDGLQMECIHCARCIDACNTVMEKVGREPGLIRYSSQAVLAGERVRFLRARVVVYPIILFAVMSALLVLAGSHAPADIRFIRDRGQPYYTLPTGEISNQMRVRITNRSGEPRSYALDAKLDGFRITTEDDAAEFTPGETRSVRILLIADRAALAGNAGAVSVPIEIRDDSGFSTERVLRFLGPMNIGVGDE